VPIPMPPLHNQATPWIVTWGCAVQSRANDNKTIISPVPKTRQHLVVSIFSPRYRSGHVQRMSDPVHHRCSRHRLSRQTQSPPRYTAYEHDERHTLSTSSPFRRDMMEGGDVSLHRALKRYDSSLPGCPCYRFRATMWASQFVCCHT